jgi:hypothetical protein
MSSPRYMVRAPMPVGQWLLHASVPAAAAVKASAAKYEQDDEDDQKCVGIHGSLLGEIENQLALLKCSAFDAQLFFFPVTSSHFSPSSFLMPSTFFDASSFIATKAARAAA